MTMLQNEYIINTIRRECLVKAEKEQFQIRAMYAEQVVIEGCVLPQIEIVWPLKPYKYIIICHTTFGLVFYRYCMGENSPGEKVYVNKSHFVSPSSAHLVLNIFYSLLYKKKKGSLAIVFTGTKQKNK